MKKKKVSIIMPVYNSALYLDNTINSIIRQTFSDFELIIVDDCSTDNSVHIINNYCLQNSNIKLIECISNGGQSRARNMAIQYAIGEYIYFMDSDDILPQGAIEVLVNEIETGNYDIVIGDVRTIGVANEKLYSTRCVSSEIYTNNNDIINRYTKVGWCVAPWAKLFSKNFLLTHNIQFKEGIILEDELFTFTYVYYAQKVKIIPDIVYDYYIRGNSTMTQKISVKHLNGMRGDIEGMKAILSGNYSSPLTSCIITMSYRLAETVLLGDFKSETKEKYLLFLEAEVTFPIILRSLKFGITKVVKSIMFLLPMKLWYMYIKMLGRA